MGSRKFLDPLRLVVVTTTQRDALSGVATGDRIYNSTLSCTQTYTGSAWQSDVTFDTLAGAAGEAIIRAQSLNQMAAPTALVDMNAQRATNAADATTDTGLATLGQGKPDVQSFTTPGTDTWEKPAGAILVLVEAIGAGGGGCGGDRRAAGVDRKGGGGGQSGAAFAQFLPASVCGSTETVTIGAIGTGGAGATSDSTNGTAGTNGGQSSFGTLVVVAGGESGNNLAGLFPGLGGGVTPSSSQLPQGYGGTHTPLFGTTTPGVAGGSGVAGGGGSGGGITTGNVEAAGRNSGAGSGAASVLGTANANGTNGGGGANGLGGAGGSGGASRDNGGGAAYNGGTGGSPGGGGGGGGSSLNGNAGGAGGNGGTAWIRVTTFR